MQPILHILGDTKSLKSHLEHHNIAIKGKPVDGEINDSNSLIESKLELKKEKNGFKKYETNDLSEPKVEIKKRGNKKNIVLRNTFFSR